MRCSFRPLWILCLLLFTVHSSLAQPATPQGGEFGDYVRFQEGSPKELQTSVITLRSPQGRTLDLISAVHLANSGYYRDLNERFASYDVVLYEMILPQSMAGRKLPSRLRSDSGVAGLQSFLGRTLGLTTQMDGIDYSPDNFVHADLTSEALSETMARRQESVFSYLQKAMMSADGTEAELGISDQELADLNLVAVLSGNGSPRDKRTLKVMMANVLANSGGTLATMNDTALVSSRNVAALRALDQQSEAGHQRMALFYGAAHMPDLEKRLKKKGWTHVSRQWLTAWTI